MVLPKASKRNVAEAALWLLAFVASYIVAQYAVLLVVQLLFWAGVQWDVGGTVSLLVIRVAMYVVIGLLLAGLLA